MKLMVTGSEGFLGKHVVRIAVERGHDVECVDRKIAKTVQLYDVSEYDAVIHLAADIIITESFENPWQYVDNNINTLRYLQKAKRLVFASSAAVYAEPSPYGLTKQLGEYLLPVNSVSLRLFNPFGPGEDHFPETHIVPLLAEGNATLYNNGEQVRDFIHVEDAAEAFVRAAELGIIGAYDLCDTPLTIKEVADLMGVQYTLTNAPRDDGDTLELTGNPRPLQKALFWKPKHNVREELKKYETTTAHS